MSQRTSKELVLSLVLTFVLVLPAVASHNEPAKAKKVKGQFVTAYEECTAPNVAAPPGFLVGPPPSGLHPAGPL